MIGNKRYWGVWKHGLEWPALYASAQSAHGAAHILARQNVGEKVVMLEMVEVGSVIYPDTPEMTGDCLPEEISETAN